MTAQDPSFIDHAIALYAELEKRSELDSDGKLKFEGSKVEAFRACGISQAFYSISFRVLDELGCTEQIRRGDRHHPSIVLLHGAPSREQLKESYRSDLTTPSTLATMREWVSQLEQRIMRIEQEVGIGSQETPE